MPTVYLNIPNGSTGSVDLLALISASYPGYNCVTASVANLCYGLDVTGSFAPIFSGSLSGFYYNAFTQGSPTKRNNCTGGKTGSFAIPFVNIQQFSSSVSFADASTSASTYLAANSQSMVNGTIGTSPGVCFTSGARIVLPSNAVFESILGYTIYPSNIDLQITTNLPLTLSVLATSSLWTQFSQGYSPDWNDPGFQVVDYFSQSLYTSSSFDGWFSNYFNPISGAVYIKATGADGKKINCGDVSLSSKAGLYNGNYIQAYPQQYIIAISPRIQEFIDISEGTVVSSSTFVPRAGLLLENNLSSSWIDEDHIRTFIIPIFTTGSIWTNNNFTASILWTTESSYPSQSDARWTLLGNSLSGSTTTFFRTGSFNGVNKVYGLNRLVSTVGASIGLASTASYSGYTYIKFESGSTLIPNLGINTARNVTIVESGSYNDIIRFRTNYTSSMPSPGLDYWKIDAYTALYVTMSNTYL